MAKDKLENLQDVLVWIKDHNKRSIAHTIILIALALPCAGMFGATLGALIGFSSEIVAYVALTYFVAIVTALFVF